MNIWGWICIIMSCLLAIGMIMWMVSHIIIRHRKRVKIIKEAQKCPYKVERED